MCVPLVVALGIAVLSGCGGARADDAPVETKAFGFSGGSLTVDSDHSDLEIVPADVREVRVTRQVDGWVFMGNGPEASWRLADGRLTLRVECDAVAASCAARHRIEVPRSVAVSVENDNGRVLADGFATAFSARSDNGDVIVRRAGGELDLQSGNGGVSVDAESRPSVVRARTDNGDIRLSLGSVPRQVSAYSDNGDVEVGLPGSVSYAVDGSSDNGDVRIDVPVDQASGHSVSARSDNGEVVVRAVN
ncbi:DUF4097 family beta strand repeat-containing protein [Streptomyces sp. NPDC085481]|uniref:DUF4097 family beta strand repeat-containing protein n=1 Tax=Streptomyces sp. NPDC085481 TaxID=3365727 RepID=UPI0037CCE5E2